MISIMKDLDSNKRWLKNASVFKQHEIINSIYNMEDSDYPERLLPFYCFESWKDISIRDKEIVKGLAFIIYQYKTIIIETKFISPVCNLLLTNNYVLKGISKQNIKSL
ncbi:hypothetical protein N9818_00735 [Arcobacteraceae bacterium]|nr:hypothetical protein [Arcobacteraceae bacterium]